MDRKEFNKKYLLEKNNYNDLKELEEEKIMVMQSIFKNNDNKFYKYYSLPLPQNTDFDSSYEKELAEKIKNSYVMKGIIGKYAYLSNPNSFNDPFDCVLGFDFSSSIEKQILIDYRETLDKRMKRVVDEYFNWSEEYKIKSKIFEKYDKFSLFEIYNGFNSKSVLEKYQLSEYFYDDNFDLYLFTYIIHNEEILDYICSKDESVKKEIYFPIFSKKLSLERKIEGYYRFGKKMCVNDSQKKTNEFLELLENRKKTFDFIKIANDECGVLCLTPKWNNLLMWAHYGNSHKGICVEYDISNCEKAFFENLFPVDYVKERICVDESDVDNLGRPLHEKIEKKNYSALLCKGDEWSYEEEWRVITHIDDEKERYLKLNITSVMFGVSCPEIVKKIVREELKRLNISTYDLKMNPYKYEIEKI